MSAIKLPVFDVPVTPWGLISGQRMIMRRLWNGDYSLRDPVMTIAWNWSCEVGGGTFENPHSFSEAKRRIEDAEFDVRLQLECVRHQVECLEAGAEVGYTLANTPAMDLIHFGTGPLATAFGARFVVREGLQPFIEPVIHTPEEALKLTRPNLEKEGICPLILERLHYYHAATQGNVIVTPCDTAGPWSLATQIWHYEDILEAIRTHPAAVHAFLDLVTDTILEWYNLQEAHLGRWGRTHSSFSWPWAPRGIGIGDDCLVTVSPATFEEFFLPYNNRLSREYGGLFYHCCMGYDGHFESLAKTDQFMGFDAQPSHNDFDRIEATLTKAHGIWTRVCSPDDMALIRRLHGKVGMLFNVGGDTRAEAIAKAKDFLAELRAL